MRRRKAGRSGCFRALVSPRFGSLAISLRAARNRSRSGASARAMVFSADLERRTVQFTIKLVQGHVVAALNFVAAAFDGLHFLRCGLHPGDAVEPLLERSSFAAV